MPVEITKRLFDVDDYHRMAQAGILSEVDRVELIDGEIVAMTPIGPRHNAAVNRANRALVTVVGDQAIVQVQGSVRLAFGSLSPISCCCARSQTSTRRAFQGHRTVFSSSRSRSPHSTMIAT